MRDRQHADLLAALRKLHIDAFMAGNMDEWARTRRLIREVLVTPEPHVSDDAEANRRQTVKKARELLKARRTGGG